MSREYPCIYYCDEICTKHSSDVTEYCVQGPCGDETSSNADRIRAMSDEELARFLAGAENRRSATGGGALWKGADHALDWLRQPAEEEEEQHG